jgi:hypothetical protein
MFLDFFSFEFYKSFKHINIIIFLIFSKDFGRVLILYVISLTFHIGVFKGIENMT